MANRARHAFGSEAKISEALAAGTIDAYDILFLDEKKVGWVTKDGEVVIAEPDLSELEAKMATKVGSDEVDAKIANALDNLEYEVSHKPEGTLVDYRDKEVRVMCPVDTKWALQNSGEGADPNAYYIGVKAYAPSDDVVSFKEDLAEIISDNEMYYFEGNEFAGIDADGRKYSIVWLPVAKYENDAWTYYGASSSRERFIGWYYSVEWYNAEGKIVASDCIRINLSNENCYSSIKPYYVADMMKEVETKIEEKIAESESSYEIIEF